MRIVADFELNNKRRDECTMSKFEKLLEPTKIGVMELRNKIVMPPIGTNLNAIDGSVTDYYINYHAERAKGGVGLQIMGVVAIDPLAIPAPCVPRIYHDKFIVGLSRVTRAVHEYGGKCAAQLHHAGRQTYSSLIGKQIVAPSAIPCKLVGEVPRELTINEIEGLVEAFGEGALRAKMAGFDAVEFHGAHGYLICQFLSPYSNRRTDKYGGDLEGRMQFALEVVERAKEKAGADFPMIFRMSGDEYVEGGLTLKETKKIAQRLEKAGVDAIHVSAGNYDSMLVGKIIAPMYLPKGGLVHLAEAIKKGVNVPVIAVGSIDPKIAEEIIREGKADLVSMGRALIADPELPKKLAEGRKEDICRCIRCNEGCIGRVLSYQPISCSINASVGREKEYEIRPALKPNKVVVAGGGPGGMETARVAALRGHEVTLFEKEDELGGHMRESTVPAFKQDIKPFREWLSTQVKKLGVKVELGKEVTPKVIAEMRPDVVIVATGSTPLIPKIPGIEKPIVATATDVLLGKAEVADEIVVAGGGLVGCETSLFLAEKGKRVTMVEMLPDIAIDVEMISKFTLMELLTEKGVKWLTNTKIEEVTDEGVVTIDRNLRSQTIKGDTVVLAMGFKSNRGLYKALQGKVKELYSIGDCVEPRKIIHAIHEGSFIARQI
jgi:2,4-dienoyl-CoA reductase-like NADH-dependent reductase (Old Yellow Enzyme family)/thioredoxin reductase